MLANILKLGGVSALAGSYYYLTYRKIRINHPIIALLFQQLQLYVFPHSSSAPNTPYPSSRSSSDSTS
jgi:hypothetical protein